MNAAPLESRLDLLTGATYELALGMRHLGTNGLLETV